MQDLTQANEKYCGDLIQKKTYTADFLSHEKKRNTGQEEFVIIRDHHEPLVSRELFERANRILDARSLSQKGSAKHSSRYPFSGKIKCGRCGASYVARYKTRKDGSRYKAWRCYEAVRHGSPHLTGKGETVGCPGESIRNEDAVCLMSLVFQELPINRKRLEDDLIRTIEGVLFPEGRGMDPDALAGRIRELERKKTRLIDLCAGGDIARDEFLSLKSAYDREMERLNALSVNLEERQILREKQRKQMEDIRQVIRELISGVPYEDEFYAHMLDQMVVHDRDHLDVSLKMLPYTWSFACRKAWEAAGRREELDVSS